ncbi:hypothetical protein JCM24511_01751 [Saitozyma sp. JCM 24511]|nr:hypothetical protein JCM24511_01751 [Saitozyma sp. JCM 24511]
MSHIAEMTSVSVTPLWRHWRETSLISETRNKESSKIFVASEWAQKQRASLLGLLAERLSRFTEPSDGAIGNAENQ